MGDDGQLSEDEFARWIPVTALTSLFRTHFTAPAIWRQLALKRISDDDLFCAARKATFSGRYEDKVLHRHRIDPALWGSLPSGRPSDQFWDTGDIHFSRYEYGGKTDISCVEVRFDPEGVERLKPIEAPVAVEVRRYGYEADRTAFLASQAPEATSLPTTTSPIRYPLSPSTLAAWWAMCRSIKPAESWTVPEMTAFLDQCFPGHTVSRDRVRKLRPNAKSGPKGRSAELV